jgi:transposase
MNCTTLGRDVAKQTFQLHGVDARGQVVVQKRVSRSKLRETIAQLPPCRIGMEACGSAQYWVGEFEQFGYTVKLIYTIARGLPMVLTTCSPPSLGDKVAA